MKKTIIISILSLFLAANIFGQSNELHYRNGVWQGDEKLSASEVRAIMSYNSEALRLYNSGKTMEIIGYVLVVPGAFFVGYDLGTRLAGGEGSTAMLVAGGGGLVAGLVIGLVGEGKVKQSVTLYNSTQKGKKISLGLTPTGNLGLTMNF